MVHARKLQTQSVHADALPFPLRVAAHSPLTASSVFRCSWSAPGSCDWFTLSATFLRRSYGVLSIIRTRLLHQSELATLHWSQAQHEQEVSALLEELQQAAESNERRLRRAGRRERELRERLHEEQLRNRAEVERLTAEVGAVESHMRGEREGVELRLRQTEVSGCFSP
jgi:hypothetical protein